MKKAIEVRSRHELAREMFADAYPGYQYTAVDRAIYAALADQVIATGCTSWRAGLALITPAPTTPSLSTTVPTRRHPMPTDTEREKLVAELDRLGAKLRSARHECSRIGDKWDRAEDALRDYDLKGDA